MSTFRRAVPSASTTSSLTNQHESPTFRGVKPFINNQYLTSSGLRELDTLIGGGFLLGSLIIVEPALFGSYGNDILRYFAAEGLVNEHSVYTNTSLKLSLPLELSTAQKVLKAQVQDTTQTKDAKLTIAWQYEKYSKSITDTRFCHSYDLSKQIQEPLLINCTALNMSNVSYREIFAKMQEALVQDKNCMIRFILPDIASPALYGEMTASHETDLIQFLRATRGLLSQHRNRVICMITLPTFGISSPFIRQIRHLSDYSFELSSFLGEGDMLPPELSEFSGLFFVHKLARIHSLTSHTMESVKLGIKRDRRKLKLENLHLPPEGSRSQKTEKKSNDISF